jgi:hypothetical protein
VCFIILDGCNKSSHNPKSLSSTAAAACCAAISLPSLQKQQMKLLTAITALLSLVVLGMAQAKPGYSVSSDMKINA